MNMDGITLAVIVRELQSLSDAKIERIYQPLRDEVTIYLHTRAGKKRLMLSASAADCRIHLTEQTRQNPEKAPNFCMVLRKYLTAGRIASIEQAGLDRIVRIGIDSKDEMGVLQRYTLILELMGKYSNLILCGADGRILDSIRHVSLDVSSKRQVLPGLTYILPPSEKKDPRVTPAEVLAESLTEMDLPEQPPAVCGGHLAADGGTARRRILADGRAQGVAPSGSAALRPAHCRAHRRDARPPAALPANG